MKINKLVKISDLFDIEYGNGLELINLVQCKRAGMGAVPFVSRTEQNNGVSAFVEEIPETPKNPAHTLSVAAGGSVLAAFYQPVPFYTGFHVLVLSPKRKTGVAEMIFYAQCIKANKYKYNYGRQANKTLKDILIPAEISPELNKRLVLYYEKLKKQISAAPASGKKLNLEKEKWEYFGLVELFNIKGSKTTPIVELEEYGKGKYPYITTRAADNGTEGFYDFYTEDGNVLTADSAVLGYCAYQALPFSASDHVEKLIPKFKMNAFTGAFLAAVINLEQYRYNYGRKCSQTRMAETKIKLPAKNGAPDFLFMENYIKSLPYSSALASVCRP